MRPLLLLPLLSLLLAACGHSAPPPAAAPTPQALAAHSEEFKPGVVKVTDGVYVAIGYGIANSILLEGDDGVIVVDTMESVESAQKVLAEFRKVTDKPVKAIVYTHSHPDHIGGAAAFVRPGAQIPVYAQEDVARNMDKTAAELQPAITRRSLRMYGEQLPPDERINLGIGGFLDLHQGSTIGTLRPTRTFRDQLEDTVAGIHFQLVHAPGETEDTLFLWLPEKGVLLCGDDFYKSFPNLYTIRGTSYRDPKLWAASLDRMRALHARYLVPSHTRPLSGAEAVDAALTDYRDAIRYVYDQTIRQINLGQSPDQIAAQLQLPPRLAASPYLQPFYGKPSWSARSIFAGNLGWYSGDAADLQPLPPQEEARHMVELAGGGAALDQRIEAALKQGEAQWALQLSGYALRADPGDARARSARATALRTLGGAETNPPARDWYFVAARELEGSVKLPQRAVAPTPQMLAAMPLPVFFDGMAVNLHAEDCLDRVTSVAFVFSDSGERYTYIVRRGVSELVPGTAADADLQVSVSTQAFKELLAGLRNPALSIATDFHVDKGSKLDFAAFMRLFQPPAEAARGNLGGASGFLSESPVLVSTMNNPQIGVCGACIAALLLGSGTALAVVKPPQPETTAPKPAQIHPHAHTPVHRGKASIYSRKLAHKPMADGSKLDLNSNAAASKQLPLGSKAVVTNLRNGRSAEVTIQDRGPYVDGRIIDLSPHTAGKLDMQSEGVVPVQVTPLPAAGAAPKQEVADRQPR